LPRHWPINSRNAATATIPRHLAGALESGLSSFPTVTLRGNDPARPLPEPSAELAYSSPFAQFGSLAAWGVHPGVGAARRGWQWKFVAETEWGPRKGEGEVNRWCGLQTANDTAEVAFAYEFFTICSFAIRPHTKSCLLSGHIARSTSRNNFLSR
jgi:hypothetical protein